VIFIRLGNGKMVIIIGSGDVFDWVVKNHELQICFSTLLGR
jgi:hypothetical protein